jgi:hypothetical protein
LEEISLDFPFNADDMEDEDEVMAEDNDDGFSPEALKLGGKKVNWSFG